MNDPRRQRFALYLRDLADEMGLRDWTFRIADDPPAAPCAAASIHCWEGRKQATVRLGEDFLDGSPEERRHYLTHELVHCHFMPAWEVAVEALPAAVVPAFRRLMEYGIDAMADVMAPRLPRPPQDS